MSYISPENLRVATTGAGFSLAAALANLANPTGTIVGYTRDLFRWLERFGVDETNFERCMTAAQSLAYPNKNGMMISDSITNSDVRLERLSRAQLPLPLTFSKALGRYIVKEPEVCYMASTTACLLTHHDPSYVRSALTSMILDKGGHQIETKYTYEVWRAPTKAVISKVVDSIFLNISNSGHKTEQLPTELTHLHVHVVDDTNFAAIVMQVQRTSNDLLLRADRFPGDIVLWLLNHFEGYLEVYVESERVYEAKLGVATRKITTIIEGTCSDDHRTCNSRPWPVILAEVIDGKPCRLVGGSCSEDLKSCSYQRQELYTTDNLMNTTYVSNKTHLGGEARNQIRHVARRITKWLMHVPLNIKEWPQLVGFCFKTELELDEDRDRSRDFIIGQLLFRSPRLLNERTGESISSAPIFKRPQWQGSPMGSQNTDPEQWGSSTTPEEVLKNFPSAEEMLNDIRNACQCPNCRNKGSLSGSKRGCLRYSAVLELCTLLSHALVDALGGDDVSGAPVPEDTMSAVITLLSETIDQEIVRWDTWFGVAASAITGCCWDSFSDATADSGDEGSTSWAGVQYGSLAVLAPWLDFCAPLEVRGAFRLHVFEGSIVGIKDDVALIQTDTPPPNNKEDSDRMDIVENEWEKLVNIDDTTFEVQKALFRAENSVHRLMVIVKVNNYLHLVDPTRSMMSLSRSQQGTCKHRRTDYTPKQLEDMLVGSNLDVKIRTFEDIFVQWTGSTNIGAPNDDSASLDLSLVLDDRRKAHIALAVSSNGVILRDSRRCCFPCALEGYRNSNIDTSRLRAILSYDGMQGQQVAKRART